MAIFNENFNKRVSTSDDITVLDALIAADIREPNAFREAVLTHWEGLFPGHDNALLKTNIANDNYLSVDGSDPANPVALKEPTFQQIQVIAAQKRLELSLQKLDVGELAALSQLTREEFRAHLVAHPEKFGHLDSPHLRTSYGLVFQASILKDDYLTPLMRELKTRTQVEIGKQAHEEDEHSVEAVELQEKGLRLALDPASSDDVAKGGIESVKKALNDLEKSVEALKALRIKTETFLNLPENNDVKVDVGEKIGTSEDRLKTAREAIKNRCPSFYETAQANLESNKAVLANIDTLRSDFDDLKTARNKAKANAEYNKVVQGLMLEVSDKKAPEALQQHRDAQLVFDELNAYCLVEEVKEKADKNIGLADAVDAADDFGADIAGAKLELEEFGLRLEAIQKIYQEAKAIFDSLASQKTTKEDKEKCQAVVKEAYKKVQLMEEAIVRVRGRCARQFEAQFNEDPDLFLGRAPKRITGSAKTGESRYLFMNAVGEKMHHGAKYTVNDEYIQKTDIPKTSPWTGIILPSSGSGVAASIVGRTDSIMIHGQLMEEGDIVRSTTVFLSSPDPTKPLRGVLEQDHNGGVIDNTDDDTYKELSPEQKLDLAVKMAKMLLLNCEEPGTDRDGNPKKVTISLLRGDPERANLLIAVLREMKPDFVDIDYSRIPDAGPQPLPKWKGLSSWIPDEATFFKEQIPQGLDRVIGDEKSVVEKVNEGKGGFKERKAEIQAKLEAGKHDEAELLQQELDDEQRDFKAGP